MYSGVCRAAVRAIPTHPAFSECRDEDGGSQMHHHEFGRPSEGVLQRKKTLSDFLEKIQDTIFPLQLACQLGGSDGNYCNFPGIFVRKGGKKIEVRTCRNSRKVNTHLSKISRRSFS